MRIAILLAFFLAASPLEVMAAASPTAESQAVHASPPDVQTQLKSGAGKAALIAAARQMQRIEPPTPSPLIARKRSDGRLETFHGPNPRKKGEAPTPKADSAPVLAPQPIGKSAKGSVELQELSNGDVVQVDLAEVAAGGADGYAEYFFTTPPGITTLSVSFRNVEGDRDIDVTLKADEPFTDMSVNTLFGEAAYYSGGIDGNESVSLIGGAQPTIEGRTWYVGLTAFPGAASQARLAVEWGFDLPPDLQVQVDFDTCPAEDELDSAPWNDNTAFTPSGSNPGTTLGEARRNAMLRAAEILSAELRSTVPVRIRACWSNLGGTDNSATLASAGPDSFWLNTPGLPLVDTIYARAPVTKLAGTELCRIDGNTECGGHDLRIRFNTDVDSDIALGSTRWWYGFDAQPSRTDSDFVSVAVHEIAHGLGFLSLIDEDGSLPEGNDGEPLPDVYSSFLIDNTNGEAIPLLDESFTDADRLNAMTSRIGLAWLGAEASVAEPNILSNSGDGYTRLFAPNPYNGGSSVSHLDSVYCELMGAFNTNCVTSPHRSLGLSRGIMNAVGWASASNIVPFEGLLFDRGRSGHGFDLAPAGSFDADGNPVYILLFYSYGPGGQTTEWFLATGVFIHGAFQAIRGPEGFGLAKFTYDPDNGSGQPQVRNEQAFGQVGLSFNSPEIHPACNDGTNRASASGLAVFTWVTGNTSGDWCVEPIIQRSQRPATDFGGLWFSTLEDQGWGFSLANIERGDGSVDLFILLYVYDANGNPAWFQGSASDFEVGTPITFDMEQLTGYARTQTPVDTVAQAGGTLTLTLVEPVNDINAGNRIDLAVTIQGGAGGEWVREDVPIQRLSADR